MPGIFGFIEKKRLSAERRTAVLDTMQHMLKHLPWYHEEIRVFDRGAVGSVSVGSRCTLQEITFAGKQYIVMIDGYVYAVGQEKSESFEHSAALILEGFLAQGDAFLPRVRGNYTIAIMDCVEQRLVLWNDRIGPRRIFYADLPDLFVFATEIKAICFLSECSRSLNWKGVADFMNYGYILGEDTFLREIKLLRSASMLVFQPQAGNPELKTYWRPVYSERSGSPEAYADEGLALLRCSIKEKLAQVESVISPISGGLDSRLILATIHALNDNKPLKPVTYGQRFSYEYKNALKVCGALGYRNHDLVTITPEALLPAYRQAVWLTEGMIPLTNAHLLLLPRALEKGYACLLNGIYGGPTNYAAEYYRRDHIDANLSHTEKSRDIQQVLSLSPRHYEGIFAGVARDFIKEHARQSIADELANHLGVSDRFCNQRDAFFIENRMRRCICQSSLYRFYWEEQLPLSHYGLYDLYLSIPPAVKLERDLLKNMLVRGFPTMAAISDANTGLNLFQKPTAWYERRRKLEHDFKYYVSRLSAGRVGFYDKSTYAHYGRWFQKHKPTNALFREELLAPGMVEAGIFDTEKLLVLFRNVLHKGVGFNHLARLVTFSIWFRLFMLGEGVTSMQDQVVIYANDFK